MDESVLSKDLLPPSSGWMIEAAGPCEMSVHLSLHSTTSQKASVHGYHLENRMSGTHAGVYFP